MLGVTREIRLHCSPSRAALDQLARCAGWPEPVLIDLAVRPREREVLRYLGIPSPSSLGLESPLRGRLEQAVEWASAALRPQGVLATYPVAVETSQVKVTTGTGVLTLHSHDLASVLRGALLVSLFAVTAGDRLDAEVARLSKVGRLTDAAFLDAVGSDCAEAAADALNDRLAAIAAHAGYLLTDRFSPGYGDLTLAVQPQLAGAAGAPAIGITVQPSLMMLPLKSITAIVGWLAAPPDRERQATGGCEDPCSRCGAADCRYRRSPGSQQKEGEAR